MSLTLRIILTLVNIVIIAASSVGDETKPNGYFMECREKYSLKNGYCMNVPLGGTTRRCINGSNVQIYCASSSPITVVIARLERKKETSFPETLNITSTASFTNGHKSYCVEIAGETSVEYVLKCRERPIDRPNDKWVPFIQKNDRLHQGSSFNPQPLQYVEVKDTSPIKFCDSIGSILPENVPVLLPCDTWHKCTIVLANRYKKLNHVNVTLVDLSTTDSIPSSCRSTFWALRRTSAQLSSKQGLLAVHHERNSEFLLPYSPPSKEKDINLEAFVALKIKRYQHGLNAVVLECQSSVMHSCGFDIVTNSLQIEHPQGDCHRHFMTIKPIQGLKGSITFSAFNAFRGTWESKTEYFGHNDTKISNESKPTETTSDAGNNNSTNVYNEDKATETTYNAGGDTTEKLSDQNKTSETSSHAEKKNATDFPSIQDYQDSGRTTLIFIIVGAVLGGIFLSFLVLVPLLIYFYKTIHLQRRRIRLTEEEICEFMEGMQKEKAKSKGIHNVFVLPYDRSLEVSKIAVDFNTTILGSGAFGKVLKGRYKGEDVAIKTIDGTTLNADAFRCLLSELKIMSYLGKHEHVMELVGAITSGIKTGEVFLILEYCAHGSAISYIREHREGFISLLSDDKTTYVQNSSVTLGLANSGLELSSEHLVRWSYEVASGMEYVSARNIYHGDLAARNILLTENLTVKVGDFGLSRQLDMEKYSCYVQKKECPLPLKWMAIESLRDLKFSIQSDVWSFGVTMWEFFSLGTIPYPGMEWNNESWKSLCEGVRLDRPEFASLRIYNNIMRKCWEEVPKDRPTFSALKAVLKNELEEFTSIETGEASTLARIVTV